MKAMIERLSADLSERYVLYIETLLVDLWSDAGRIEFRCGFSLRSDHVLRQIDIKLPADVADNDSERLALIHVVFEELEEQIDIAIAESKSSAH